MKYLLSILAFVALGHSVVHAQDDPLPPAYPWWTGTSTSGNWKAVWKLAGGQVRWVNWVGPMRQPGSYDIAYPSWSPPPPQASVGTYRETAAHEYEAFYRVAVIWMGTAETAPSTARVELRSKVRARAGTIGGVIEAFRQTLDNGLGGDLQGNAFDYWIDSREVREESLAVRDEGFGPRPTAIFVVPVRARAETTGYSAFAMTTLEFGARPDPRTVFVDNNAGWPNRKGAPYQSSFVRTYSEHGVQKEVQYECTNYHLEPEPVIYNGFGSNEASWTLGLGLFAEKYGVRYPSGGYGFLMSLGPDTQSAVVIPNVTGDGITDYTAHTAAWTSAQSDDLLISRPNGFSDPLSWFAPQYVSPYLREIVDTPPGAISPASVSFQETLNALGRSETIELLYTWTNLDGSKTRARSKRNISFVLKNVEVQPLAPYWDDNLGAPWSPAMPVNEGDLTPDGWIKPSRQVVQVTNTRAWKMMKIGQFVEGPLTTALSVLGVLPKVGSVATLSSVGSAGFWEDVAHPDTWTLMFSMLQTYNNGNVPWGDMQEVVFVNGIPPGDPVAYALAHPSEFDWKGYFRSRVKVTPWIVEKYGLSGFEGVDVNTTDQRETLEDGQMVHFRYELRWKESSNGRESGGEE